MQKDDIKELLANHKEAYFGLKRSYWVMLGSLVLYTLFFGLSLAKNVQKTNMLENRIRQLEQDLKKQPTCCPPCPAPEPQEADEPKAEPSTPSPAPSGSHRIIDGVDIDEPCIVNDSIYLLPLPCQGARILSSHLVIAGPSSVFPSPLSIEIAGDFGYFHDK